MVGLNKTRGEHKEASLLVQAAFDLAHNLKIPKVVIQADEFSDVRLIQELRPPQHLIWLTRGKIRPPRVPSLKQVRIAIPETGLSRMSQVKMGLFLAVFHGHLNIDESALCLCAVAGSEKLDTILITNPKRDFPWFNQLRLRGYEHVLASKGFAQIINIALQLAAEGREGRPIGTAFVIGNRAELKPYLRQLVINPFAGHSQKTRSVYRPELLETIREFTALDGAFVVDINGTLLSAGTYLDASPRKVRLEAGYGARHASAAAITAVTNSVAIVISESSRNVTVYFKGRKLLELEEHEKVCNEDMT